MENLLTNWKFLPSAPQGVAYFMTLPFPGSYGDPMKGYKIGRFTPSIVAPSQYGDPPQWDLWMMDDQGVMVLHTTHVKNELLDRYPWVEVVLVQLGVLEFVDTRHRAEVQSGVMEWAEKVGSMKVKGEPIVL